MSIYMAYMLVFACWFGLRMIWYGAEILFMKEKVKPEVIEEPTADPYSCPLFEVRLLENKLVDAGIIKEREMSICGSDECDDCQNTHKIIMAYERYETRLILAGRRKASLELEDVRHDYYKVHDGGGRVVDSWSLARYCDGPRPAPLEMTTIRK